MLLRFLFAALAFVLAAGIASAQDQADPRRQLLADLSAMEKSARERVFDAAEWETFSRLEAAANELIRAAEARQAELDRSGKAELYRLFVRASRLEAAEKANTLSAEQAVEKARIEREIVRLAEPLLLGRLKELTDKKEAGLELGLRETAVLDGLSRWQAASGGEPQSSPPPDGLNSPRMEVRELVWVEQIAIMEEQGNVRRDLRLKDQIADIYRLLARRAESQGEGRDETMRRLAAWKAKQRN